jgi:hypothetical protein
MPTPRGSFAIVGPQEPTNELVKIPGADRAVVDEAKVPDYLFPERNHDGTLS